MNTKISKATDHWNKDRAWTSGHSAASGRIRQHLTKYSDWHYVNSMVGRLLACLIPSFLLLIAFWTASQSERAFEIMIYPLGLAAYPLSFIQLVLLFVLWRAVKKYRAIVQNGYSTPTADEVWAANNDRRLIEKYIASHPAPHINTVGF
ncbi:hypothetical protein N9H56_05405 [Pseudomonadales bacterium]|nr:hypothetical protein [Pseudomonadales bacterium]